MVVRGYWAVYPEWRAFRECTSVGPSAHSTRDTERGTCRLNSHAINQQHIVTRVSEFNILNHVDVADAMTLFSLHLLRFPRSLKTELAKYKVALPTQSY